MNPRHRTQRDRGIECHAPRPTGDFGVFANPCVTADDDDDVAHDRVRLILRKPHRGCSAYGDMYGGFGETPTPPAVDVHAFGVTPRSTTSQSRSDSRT
jgi:hypothetical protein